MEWSHRRRSGPSPESACPLTYQHLPLAVGLGHLVGAAHLAQTHASQDEDDEAGAAAVLPRRLVLVPVPVAGAGGREGERLMMFICTSSLTASDLRDSLTHSLCTHQPQSRRVVSIVNEPSAKYQAPWLPGEPLCALGP